MAVEITKKSLRAIANLMPEQGTYLQRVDRIAAALGYRNNATLMSKIKKETPAISQESPLKRLYTLDDLGLDAVDNLKINLLRDGLFLFIGLAGSGKTTLLNASFFDIQTRREPLISTLSLDAKKDAAHIRKLERLVEASDVSLASVHARTPRDAIRRLEILGYTPSFFDKNLRGIVCCRDVIRHAGKTRVAADFVIFESPDDVKRMRNEEVF